MIYTCIKIQVCSTLESKFRGSVSHLSAIKFMIKSIPWGKGSIKVEFGDKLVQEEKCKFDLVTKDFPGINFIKQIPKGPKKYKLKCH